MFKLALFVLSIFVFIWILEIIWVLRKKRDWDRKLKVENSMETTEEQKIA